MLFDNSEQIRRANLIPINLKQFHNSEQNKYALECFQVSLEKLDINGPTQDLTQNQLGDILAAMGFQPTDLQLQEALYWSQFNQKFGQILPKFTRTGVQELTRGNSLNNSKMKDIVKSLQPEKRKFDANAFVDWFIHNVSNMKYIGKKALVERKKRKQNQSIEINLPPIHNNSSQIQDDQNSVNQSMNIDVGGKIRSQSTYNNKPSKRNNLYSPKDQIFNVEKQLADLVKIFENMDQLRQNNGIIPIEMHSGDLDNDDQREYEERDLNEIRNIPYDPDMWEMNTEITQMRYKAEIDIKSFIQQTKIHPKIRQKLEQGVNKFQVERINANERIGKIGAISAQKRLIESKENQQLQMLDDINKMFHHEKDLLQATQVYQLLNFQPAPQLKFEQKITPGQMQDRVLYLMNNKLS